MSNYIVVGGGWASVSSTEEDFVRIQFRNSIPAGTTVTMWKNKHKDTPKHPDYLIMAAVKEDGKSGVEPKKFF